MAHSTHLFLDQRLSHKQTTDSQARTLPLLHLDTKHRLPSGMCTEQPNLHPLHFRLQTSTTSSIVKFADNTIVVGLICGEDECAYRDEVLNLSAGCRANNLFLNTNKTKEIILDLRKHRADPTPRHTIGDCMKRVHGFTLLGNTISADLT